MKKKIFLNIALLSALVALVVTGFLLFTFYDFHVKNEIKALKDYGHIMADVLSPLDQVSIDSLKKNTNPDIRITIIDLDGDVLFDNLADTQTMENHLNRIEIKNALKFGEGESVRTSTTLDKDTYYYAVLLSNKNILRISRQSASIFAHFTNILPIIFIIVLLILVFSLLISSILSKKIIQPVETIVENIENSTDNKKLYDSVVYDEIMPFIKKVEKQEKQIKYNIRNIEEKVALMDVITSNMEEGFILVDKDRKILNANASGINLLQGDEDISYHGEDFIKLSRNMKLYESLQESIDVRSSAEITLKQEEKYLNIYINPVIPDDNLIGLVILIVDFTKKHRLDLMRREFSANVSHELKTPLTSINGYAEMIKCGMAKDTDIKNFASIIMSEGSRLLSLIDSIIKLSKIEESEDQENFDIVDIYKIGKNTMENLSLLANKKNINLSLQGQPTFIKGNKNMIEELIYNLLDNAIKYTPSDGNVDLEIKNRDELAIIKVTDTGIGIPLPEQDRIFERFYTLDKSRSKNTQSTGLGLSIIKHIVERHEGTIELKSETGEGTGIIVKIKKS